MRHLLNESLRGTRKFGLRLGSAARSGFLGLYRIVRNPKATAARAADLARLLRSSQGRRRLGRSAYDHRRPLSVGLVILIVFTSLMVFRAPGAFATSAGPNSPSTNSLVQNGTSTTWTNPANVYAQDSTYATVTSLASGATTYYLEATGYGFNIPTANTTVNGVSVTVYKFATTATKNTMQDQTVSLVVGGAITGSNYATTATWPTTNSPVSYGTGQTDMWGTSLTAAQVNAANFGVAIAATNVHSSGATSTLNANVDYISITVYYTVNSVFQQASYRFYGNQDSSGTLTFATAWGGTAADDTRGAIAAPDGSEYVTGVTSSTGAGGQDLFIDKFDKTGALLWAKTWGGTGTDIGNNVIVTSDGGIAVAGYTDSTGAGLQDAVLLKLDSSGNLTWQRTWGGTNYDQGINLAQTNAGNIVMTGTTSSYGAGGYDEFIAKYNSSGTLLSSSTWGGTGTDSGQQVIATSDGGYAVAGYQNSAGGGGYDTFLLKYSSSDTLTFAKTWGGASDDEAYALYQTSDGGYAVAGETLSYGAGAADNLLLKYDSSGNLTMSRYWGSSGTDFIYDIAQGSDGTYYLSGRENTGTSINYASISSVSSSGTVNSVSIFGSNGNNYGEAIDLNSDGGFTLTGIYGSNPSQGDDVFVAKYDSSFHISTCSVSLCSMVFPAGSTPAGATDAASGTGIASQSVTGATPAISLAGANLTITTLVGLQPTMDVGSPLMGQNFAATTLGDGQPFRLRIDLNVTSADALANAQNFKLQYALRGADNLCDTSFSGETYADVTNSTPIQYYDNPNAVNNQGLTTNANDPTDGSNTLVRQTYQEAGTSSFTNPTAITAGQDGMWDFALTTSNASGGAHYCLRVVSSSGSVLNGGYSAVPEVIIPPASYNQASYRFYQNSNTQPYSTITENPTTGTDAAYFTASDGTYLYICGYDSTGSNEWRIEKRNISDGQLVSGFGTGGVVTENISAGDDRCNSIVVTGGNVYLGGYDTSTTSGEWRIEKRDATTGALVSGFGTGGAISEDVFNGTNDQIRSMATDGTNLYLAGDVGASSSDFQWRIEKRSLTDGSFINAFNTGFINENNYSANNEAPYAIVYDSGYIYVGGFDMPTANDGQYHLEKRDATTGGLISGFGTGGIVQENATTITDASGIPESITTNGITTDSSYIYTLGNDEPTVTADTEWRLEKRDKTTGALVSGFGTGGIVTENPSSTYDTTQQLQTDGTYLYASGVDRSQDSGFSEWRIEKRSVSTGALASGFGTGGIYTSNPSTGHDELRSIVLDGASIEAIGYDIVPGNYEWRMQKLATFDAGASGPDPTPLAAQNTAPTGVTTGQQFRLRFLLRVGSSAIGASGQSFKLQYAQQGADNSCDTSFSNETYADVSTSGAIQFQTNSNITSGNTAWRTTVDPTDSSNPVVLQTYQSANTFANSATIPVGSDGEWDVSLVNSSAAAGSKYCFRVVKSDGSTLNTYTTIPEVDIFQPNVSPAAPTLSTPSSGATGVALKPVFTLRTTDADSDYLMYKILIYQSDCSTLVATADETSSQTGWSGQDQQGGTAYAGSGTLASSTLATYTYTGSLVNSTTYCWKAAAIDPGGTNSFGSFSATQSFTTLAAGGSGNVILGGGLILGGGAHFGN